MRKQQPLGPLNISLLPDLLHEVHVGDVLMLVSGKLTGGSPAPLPEHACQADHEGQMQRHYLPSHQGFAPALAPGAFNVSYWSGVDWLVA